MRYILKKTVGVFGLIGILALPTQVRAATLVMNGTEDTFINQNNWNHNNGGDTNLYLGGGNNYVPLLRFDVSSLGTLAGATINSVTLTLTASGSYTISSQAFAIYQMAAGNSGWVEGTGSFSGGATGASNDFQNNTGSVPWASGGTFGNFPAFTLKAANIVTPPLYNTPITSNLVANTAYGYALSNSMIADWLGNGALASAGIILNTSVGGPTFSYYSSETGTSARRDRKSVV